ncbi:MAG: MMPL family transporter, partial [Firmicutes bacterium]|nr:MMPL family transporter [Bacillota bacterium]
MAEENKKQKQEAGFMLKLATFIVDRRNLFFLIFGLLIIASIVGTRLVKVENRLTEYLSEDTETKQGLDLMNSQFETYGSCRLMIANITYDDAKKLADEISDLSYVSLVQFDNTEEHYNDFSALFDVTFKYDENDERCLEYLDRITDYVSSYDAYISTTLGDQTSETLAKEVSKIIVYVAIIVLAVLLFTCSSFAEIPVLIITFLTSAILAMGSNFLLGTISFVSNSVAIVLQLALSVDYAVIFVNRYKDEHSRMDSREADIIALSKAIPEISASSLTTIGGLAAMLFMQFRIGPDLGIVLIKAILLSLLTVFCLMPGLIMLFADRMDKTEHRNLVPRIPFVGKFA